MALVVDIQKITETSFELPLSKVSLKGSSTDYTYEKSVTGSSDKAVTLKVKGIASEEMCIRDRKVILNEYERTGIPIEAWISSQLLMNIFEHNTPLHDGAVFIRNQRVVAATCYLPLSDNMELSKELGTRHRAGVGISEVSDLSLIHICIEYSA